MMTLPIILSFIFGAAIGSFLNVLVWRLPREESIQGRSHCPHCNHQLIWVDLIPVLSILLQRGKCRYCSKPVSFRYPVVEIITGLLFALAMYLLPVTDLFTALVFAKAMIIIAICITVFIIDFEHYLILDRVVFPGMILVMVAIVAITLTSHDLSHVFTSLLGAAAAFIPFWFLWFISKGKWMGFGDVKFVTFMGLALGLKGIIIALFISFTAGALVGILLMISGKKDFNSKLPFGTFLSVATIIALFWGARLLDLYWRLLGLA